ncbi:MAG: zinc ribbon domain-containing protein [Verrucomicrobiaceae bacterium]|nr:MAG: zinc ribbon domain-containing protein [Verrucomicrobiaceae bacterium]
MQAPTPPQPQVVVVKSGCGKVAIILISIVAVLTLLVGGCFIFGVSKVAEGVSKEMDKQETARKASVDSLEIIDFKWNKEGFGNVMEADFKIRNKGTVDLKDIEILCEHAAPSGTKIDSNRRTIFEVVKAGETREFKNFSMGFIHSQVEKSTASIVKAVPATGTTNIPAPTQP